MTLPSSPKPPEQRPELPDFWCKRFQSGATPWDAGGVPDDLKTFIERQSHPLNMLIPGCGSAWEAAWVAAQGMPVTALDFSPSAIERARELLGNWPGTLLCADFFNFTPPLAYDCIYERAFLCALPRKMWTDWAARMAELLPTGGLLAGFFFFHDDPKGPPFGLFPGQIETLLGSAFALQEDKPATGSIPVFAGRERWQVWARR